MYESHLGFAPILFLLMEFQRLVIILRKLNQENLVDIKHFQGIKSSSCEKESVRPRESSISIEILDKLFVFLITTSRNIS